MLRTALPVVFTAMLMLAPEALAGQAGGTSGSGTATGNPIPSAPVASGLGPAAVPSALRPRAAAVAGVSGPMPLARVGSDGTESPAESILQERDTGGVPFMVAGGALFIAGAVVGGDAGTLLMVGGAGVGAYGLYIYFGGS